ncbi:MAG: DUF2298 domain-containing protein, partial [Chloroflexota bacterium]
EFPFFTFLYGDLHAHAIALPYTVLVVATGTSVLLGASGKRDRPDGGGSAWPAWLPPRELAAIVLLGLLVGTLDATNTWDYPTYLALSGAFLLLADVARQGRLDWRGIWRAALKALGVLLISLIAFLPYSRHFVSAYTSVQPWMGKRTTMSQYLIIHGIFVFIIAAFILHEVFGPGSRVTPGRFARLLVTHRRRFGTALRRAGRAPRTAGRRLAFLYLSDSMLLFALMLGVLALLKLWVPLLLVALLGLSASALFTPGTPNGKRLVHLLICLGLCLDLASEFVVLTGDVGRMNTVFKLDFQVWALWSVACALALYRLLIELRRTSFSRKLVTAGAVLLIAAGLVYPVAATTARAHDRFTPLPPTDDGSAYMAVSTWQDKKPIPLAPDYWAIRWLQDNVQGSPVVLEGRGSLYSWASRISVYTGLPTVLGWDWHETQQRGFLQQKEIQQRIADVNEMYDSPSLPTVLPLLQRYHVRYVYVGPFEREIYPPAGLAKFNALPAVYARDGVKMYRVATSAG